MSGSRTVLVGFGKVAAGYAEDAHTARYYPYATHAQVLSRHPDFSWDAVVDTSDEALEAARTRWKIPLAVHSVGEIAQQYEPEVAVIATPPESRLSIIDELPTVRAVLVEKPLGSTMLEAMAFLDHCKRRGLLVQVNIWRRADETMRSLASGRLEQLVGRPQAGFGLYGDGLRNNGTHLIDLVRMLFGEIEAVQAVGRVTPYPAGPIAGDSNVSFTLSISGGATASILPLRYEHYREGYLDIWGEKGRLAIMQEGLAMSVYPTREHRALLGEREVASDQPEQLEPSIGEALYRVYSNLVAAMRGEDELWSTGENAAETARVIEAVMDSARSGGSSIELYEHVQKA